jgi:ABC-type bacteriocin/lantibiotic exporter with double-glycine peptidase domain
VAQRPRLLAGSIMDNLRYGNPDADAAKVKHAAGVAGIHNFIEGLPEGYQTEVGEKGVKLSEGQRQRLSIARAFIKDPDILILDEPTAALDNEAERSLFEKLPQLIQEKTLFVVTHRPSTIAECERVLLLNENQLVDSGSYNKLLESNAYFRDIMALKRAKETNSIQTGIMGTK